MPKRPGRGGPGSEQETVQLAGAVSKGQAWDDHVSGPRTRCNTRQTDVTNLRPGGRSLPLKITYRLCSPCKEESVPSTTQPTGRSCVSRPGGRGPGFLSFATHPPPRLPPHRGEQGGSFLFCPLRPCHRKTLPVPPFEGGDLVSVGQQHDSPRVSPLTGGNKGGLSLEEPAKGRSSHARDQEKHPALPLALKMTLDPVCYRVKDSIHILDDLVVRKTEDGKSERLQPLLPLHVRLELF